LAKESGEWTRRCSGLSVFSEGLWRRWSGLKERTWLSAVMARRFGNCGGTGLKLVYSGSHVVVIRD